MQNDIGLKDGRFNDYHYEEEMITRNLIINSCMAGVIIGILLLAYTSFDRQFNADGPIIVNASTRLIAGGEVYQNQYAYPMPAALILTPLGALPKAYQQNTFMLFNIVLAIASAILIGLATKQIIITTAITLTFAPVWWVINTGQTDLILVFAMAAYYFIYHQDNKRLNWLAGMYLSLVILKPQFGFFILLATLPYHWKERTFRNDEVTTGLIAGASILFGASFIVDPLWISKWYYAVGEYRNQSINIDSIGLFSVIGNIGVSIIAVIYGVSLKFAHKYNEHWQLLTIGIIAALMLSTVSHPYDLSLLIIPVLLILVNTKDWLNKLMSIPVFIMPAIWKYMGLEDANLAPMILSAYIPIFVMMLYYNDEKEIAT